LSPTINKTYFFKLAFQNLDVKLSDRKHMALLTRDLFLKQNEELKSFLKKVDFFAFTTDGWSSKKKKKAFISLTLHYLTRKFELETISLGIISADYEHNAVNLTDHLNKLLEQYGILNKVSIMVVDHASVMGSTCQSMGREFYGCFAHFLNLVCKLFFDNIKNCEKDLSISSDDESSSDIDECEQGDSKKKESDKFSKMLLDESDIGDNHQVLEDIEEETEEELAKEAFGFENCDFKNLSKNINTVIKKMKKVVTTFNCSNNLTRDLLKEQNDDPLNLLSDETEKRFKTTKKCVLQLIQDIITL
jgi:hypothetical protein